MSRKTPKIENPRLTMGDAMSFKFRVMGRNYADRYDFEDNVRHKLGRMAKFRECSFSLIRSSDNSDVWLILSANSTAMIDLMDRLPKLAAKNGLTIRNIK